MVAPTEAVARHTAVVEAMVAVVATDLPVEVAIVVAIVHEALAIALIRLTSSNVTSVISGKLQSLNEEERHQRGILLSFKHVFIST